MSARRSAVTTAVALLAVTVVTPSARLQPASAGLPLCAADLAMPEVARRAAADGAPSIGELRQWAGGDDAAARRCGLRALAARRDRDSVPRFVAALTRTDGRADAWLVARWAAWAAGGPDTTISAAFAPLVAALADPDVAAAAGDDGVRLLGEIASAAALPPLRVVLAADGPPERTDAAVHALARQGDPSVRARIATLGHAEADGLVTNATYEQARRIGVTAFYLLALGEDTREEGLRLASRLAPADQADAGAWAVQTLCERAVRQPGDAAALDATRSALVDALDARGIAWAGLTRGGFPCPTAR